MTFPGCFYLKQLTLEWLHSYFSVSGNQFINLQMSLTAPHRTHLKLFNILNVEGFFNRLHYKFDKVNCIHSIKSDAKQVSDFHQLVVSCFSKDYAFTHFMFLLFSYFSLQNLDQTWTRFWDKKTFLCVVNFSICGYTFILAYKKKVWCSTRTCKSVFCWQSV